MLQNENLFEKKERLTKLYYQHSKNCGAERLKTGDKIEVLEKEIREEVDNEIQRKVKNDC